MVISFSQLGKHGRLANQFFQVVGTLGLAEKYNGQAVFPEWPYEKYFVDPLPHGEMQKLQVKEKHFHYYDWQLTDSCDILGYLQSEKYFPKKNQFVFKPEFLQATKDKMPAEVWDKETILFQIRRGDYVNNPFYYQISIAYYIDALITHFPNWQDYNIIFFSDELSYCHVHFDCLKNAYFTDDFNDIEQIAIGSLCDHFIIANSSFGWWQTWLGEKPHSKIIHCGHLHSGQLQEKSEPKDYYPERWTRHQKDSYKIDLTDVTFTIPVFYDHADRKANLDLSVCILQKNFNTNIIIGEQGGSKFEYHKQWATYMNFPLENFHRTKMLNDMAMMAETPLIANWDCDVIVPPMQIYLTVKAIREGADMVFPYDGRFARMPRPWFAKIEKVLDIGIVQDTNFLGKRGVPLDPDSVGGAVFFNKDSFIEGGMENEYMISFAPEDVERDYRFRKLGYKVLKMGGCLYHLDHFIGINSSPSQPLYKDNKQELFKVQAMNKSELIEYINSWPWRHKYTEKYYRDISQGSIKSAKEVYRILNELGIKYDTVIDVGAGVGEWYNDNPNYYAIDYKIPLKQLLIPEDHYYDIDLTNGIHGTTIHKYDLCLCLEVAEHLPGEKATSLIDFLCRLSDRVLFSAAIPYQGGNGHINERWQSYWAELFYSNGFFASALNEKLHSEIYDNTEIELWYKNNIVLYEKGAKGKVKDFVHPLYYQQIVSNLKHQL